MVPGVSRPVPAGGARRPPMPQDVPLPTPLPNRRRVLVPGQPVAAFLREPYPIAPLMPSVPVGRRGCAALYVGAAREDAHPTVSGSTPAHARTPTLVRVSPQPPAPARMLLFSLRLACHEPKPLTAPPES